MQCNESLFHTCPRVDTQAQGYESTAGCQFQRLNDRGRMTNVNNALFLLSGDAKMNRIT